MADNPILVYITMPNQDMADRIGTVLVENNLVACVNIIPAMRSIYRWNGALEKADEVVLIAKTFASAFNEISRIVKDLHSAETPCILSLAIDKIEDSFHTWMRQNVGSKL